MHLILKGKEYFEENVFANIWKLETDFLCLCLEKGNNKSFTDKRSMMELPSSSTISMTERRYVYDLNIYISEVKYILSSLQGYMQM